MVDLNQFIGDQGSVLTPNETNEDENTIFSPLGEFAPQPEAEPPPVSRAVAPEIRSAIEAQLPRPEAPPSEINLLAQPPGLEDRATRELRQAIPKQIQRRQAEELIRTQRPLSDLIAYPNAPILDTQAARGLSEAEARIRQAVSLGDKRKFRSSGGEEITVLEAQLAQSILDSLQTVRKKRIVKGITGDKDPLVGSSDTQLINSARQMAKQLGGEDPSLAAKTAALYSGTGGLVRDLSGLLGMAAQSPVSAYRLVISAFDEDTDISKTLQREYTNFGEMFDGFADATNLPKTTKVMQSFVKEFGIDVDEDVASEILRQGRSSATFADRSAEFFLEGIGFLKLFKGVSIVGAMRKSANLNRFTKAKSKELLGRQVDNIGQVSPDEVMLISRSLAEEEVKKGFPNLVTRTFGRNNEAIKNFILNRRTQNLFKVSSKRVLAQQAKRAGKSTREYRKQLFSDTRLEYKQAQTALNKTERELAAAIKGNKPQDAIDEIRRRQLDQMEQVNIKYTQMYTLKNDLAPILNRDNKELLLGEVYLSLALGTASSVRGVEGTLLEPILGLGGALSGDRIVRLSSSISRNTALAGAKTVQNRLSSFGVIANKIPEQTLVRYILGKDVAFEGYTNNAGQFVRLSRSERNALNAIDENLNALSPEGRRAIAEEAVSLKELFGRLERAGLDTNEFSEAAAVIALVAPLRAVSNELMDKVALDLGSKSYLRDFVQIVENDLEMSKAVETLSNYINRTLPNIDANSVEGQELAAIFKGLQNFVKKQETDIKARSDKADVITRRIIKAIETGQEDPFRDFNMPDMPTERLLELYTEIKKDFAELSARYGDLPNTVAAREQAKKERLDVELKVRDLNVSERTLSAEKSKDRMAILAFSRHNAVKSRFDTEYNIFFRGEGDMSLDTDALFDLIAEVNTADALRRGADISSLGKLSSQEQIALFSRSTELPANLRLLQQSFNTQAKQINNKTIDQIIQDQDLDLSRSEVLNRVKTLLKDDGIERPSDVEIYGKLISIGEEGTVLRFEPQVGPAGEIIRPVQEFISEAPVDQIEFKLRDVHNVGVYARSQARRLRDRAGPPRPEDRNAIESFRRLSDLADSGIQNGLTDEAYQAYRNIGARYKTQYSDRFYSNRQVTKAIFDSKPKKLIGPRVPGQDFDYKSAATSDNWNFLDLSKIKSQEDLDDLARNLENMFGEFDESGAFVGIDPEYQGQLQTVLRKMFYKGAVDQGFIKARGTIDIGDTPISELDKFDVKGTQRSLDDFEVYDSVNLSDKKSQEYFEYFDRTDQLFQKFGISVDDAGLKTSLVSLADRNKSVSLLMDNMDADVKELVEKIVKTDGIAQAELKRDLANSIEGQLANTAGAQGNAALFLDILRTNLKLADETASGLNRMDDLADNIFNNLNKDSSLYKRLEDMSELGRRKEIKDVIAAKVREEALRVAKGKVIGTGGPKGEAPLSEVNPDELFKYLDQNEPLLVEILDGREHYNTLRDFAEFTSRVGPFAFERLGLTIATRTPGGLAMESLLSRAYAINRGVISLKYVAGEILIRKMRVNKLSALKAMLNDKETAKILSSVIRTGKLPKPKIQARLNNLLLGFIAREEVARRRNVRPSIDALGGTLGAVDSIRTTFGDPIADLFYPEDKDKPLPPLPGDNRFIRQPQVGFGQQAPSITAGD